MDQKIVGFNQFGAVIRKVKAWVESTFLTLSKDSADQSIAGVRSVSDIINLAKGASSAAPLTKITYAELKALRDGAKLIPGMQYRITDYTCTTITQHAQSAGHVFDIIVTADDERTLNAKARAIHHEGDTYFTKSDLAKWQIWYDLNNDPTKYGWADETNGKGVIYRMVDEYGNDCPYDFKNIQFKRWKITSTHNSLNNEYIGIDGLDIDGSTIPDKNDFKWFYTFSFMKKASDTLTIEGIYDSFTDSHIRHTGMELTGDNIIKPYVTDGVMQLNYTLFFSEATDDSVSFPYMNKIGSNCLYNTLKDNCSNNTFESNCIANILLDTCRNNTFKDNCLHNTLEDNCSNNTFGNICSDNTFGNICSNNTFGTNCSNNTFRNGCSNNTFRDRCTSNTFEDNCSNNTFESNCIANILLDTCINNTFKDNCSNNTFGNGCTSNTFKDRCTSNTFKDNCSNNTFGNECTNNTFGNGYSNNTFGTNCSNNTFGDRCTSNTFKDNCLYNTLNDNCLNNTFGNGCTNNTFGDRCTSNTFGDRCTGNTFGELDAPISYVNFIDVASGVSYVNIIPTSATSDMNNLRNISIHKGVKGTEGTPLVINVDVLNQDYEIIYTKAADGTLVKQIAQA